MYGIECLQYLGVAEVAQHGMGLARPGLAIGHQRRVVALENVGNQRMPDHCDGPCQTRVQCI